MRNANPRNFIVYQDGRYQYHTGDYDMAYSAVLSVLTAKKMQDEGAWILGVHSLLKQLAAEADARKQEEYLKESYEMLQRGIYVFPNSQELKKFAEMF